MFPSGLDGLSRKIKLVFFPAVVEPLWLLQFSFHISDLSSWIPNSPARCPSPAVPLRVIPTLSTQDMKTAGKIQNGWEKVLNSGPPWEFYTVGDARLLFWCRISGAISSRFFEGPSVTKRKNWPLSLLMSIISFNLQSLSWQFCFVPWGYYTMHSDLL